MSYPPDSTPFKLDVTVVSAENLLPKDTNGLSDPYCKITLARDHYKQYFKTKVISKSLNPQWNQKFTFYPQYEKSCILITVWDRDILSKDDFLGCARYPLENLTDLEAREVVIPLKKIRIFKLVDEEVRGSVTLHLQLHNVRKKAMLAYFNFQDPFDSNNRYKNAKLRDVSGNGNHGRFKNLETDNVVQTVGLKSGSYAGKFSGFNYIELPRNPIQSVAQWSISIWFLVENPEDDHVLLSALTSDPKDVKLKKSVNRPPIQIREYGKTASASQLPVEEVEETKMFLSGVLLCTRGNRFYDNFGRSLIMDHEEEDEDEERELDIYSRDTVFCPEHVSFPKKMLRQEMYLKKERSDESKQEENRLRISLMKKKKWNNIVVTYSGAYINEHINGVLVDKKRCDFQFLGMGKPMQIGGWDNDMCLRGFVGLIDNVRLFNYVLSKEEIERLLSEGKKK